MFSFYWINLFFRFPPLNGRKLSACWFRKKKFVFKIEKVFLLAQAWKYLLRDVIWLENEEKMEKIENSQL